MQDRTSQLDIAFIRAFPDLVKAGAEKKRLKLDLDRLLDVERQRRVLITESEHLRAERNHKSKAVSGAPAGEREMLLAETKTITERLKRIEADLAPLAQEFERLMLQVPNVPAPRDGLVGSRRQAASRAPVCPPSASPRARSAAANRWVCCPEAATRSGTRSVNRRRAQLGFRQRNFRTVSWR